MYFCCLRVVEGRAHLLTDNNENIIKMVQLNVSPHQYRCIFVKKWLRKKSIWRSQRKHKTQNIVPYGQHHRPAIKEVQGSNLTRVQSLRHRRPTRATWFEIFREIERRWEYWSPDDDETNSLSAAASALFVVVTVFCCRYCFCWCQCQSQSHICWISSCSSSIWCWYSCHDCSNSCNRL